MSAFFLAYFKTTLRRSPVFSLKLKKCYTNWLDGKQPTLLLHKTAQLPLLASFSHIMLVLYKRLQIIIIFNDNVIRCCFFLCFMKNFRDKTKALKM